MLLLFGADVHTRLNDDCLSLSESGYYFVADDGIIICNRLSIHGADIYPFNDVQLNLTYPPYWALYSRVAMYYHRSGNTTT